MNFQQAKRLIIRKLQSELNDLDGLTYYKRKLMLKTGVKVTSKEGRVSKTYPMGISEKYLMDFLGDKDSPYIKVVFTGERLQELLIFAQSGCKSCNVASDAAKEVIAKLLDQGADLPDYARQFCSDILRGNCPPRPAGCDPMGNAYRDRCIVDCLYSLQICGYKPMTKNSAESGTDSACHALVEALSNLGIHLSYDAVKTIWMKREGLNKADAKFDLKQEGEHFTVVKRPRK